MSKRQDTHKYTKLGNEWRKPSGKHSKIRLERNGAPAKPKAGYRTPKSERGKHPSGFDEVMVHNVQELEKVDEETEAARIGSTVGGKKREKIVEKADELGVKLLNGGETDES